MIAEFGPSAFDEDNRSVSTSRLINCYRQSVPGMGRARYQLKSVLGTSSFASTGSVFHYATSQEIDDIYTAVGGSLYRIGSGGAVQNVGTISSGLTSISSNNGAITVAANGVYYLVDGAITTPTVTPFASAGSVAFLDQYTLVTEDNGRRWAWSDLADPSTFPALNFATAEATDKNLIRVASVNGRVVLFKSNSREIWYNTGESGADAFLRLAGGVRDIGLKAYNLLCRTEQALFFIGNDNIARLTDGSDETRFSYPPVDTAISQGNPTDCFFYEDEGQKFCVIRFEDRPSWVLDLANGEWHERAEDDRQPWSARGSAKLNNAWHVVTDGGAAYKLERNNVDVGYPLIRTAVSPTFWFQERASVDLIEIFGRVGFSDLGRDAQMWIRLSRDGGDTWTEEKWRSMGTKGEHGTRMAWRAQGQARQLTIEANVSDPAELPLFSDFVLEAA